MISFQLKGRDGQARVGSVETTHGSFQTPAFMPVATHGAVKGLSWSQVRSAGSDIVLSNTYHLYLRPGLPAIERAGGVHAFLQWPGPILTDSGGFQIFSLGHKRGGKLAKIDDEGVTFRSHLDGSSHRFTPELVWDIQRRMGVDIAMPLDECPPTTATRPVIERALERTHRWLEKQAELWRASDGTTALFGIVQGGLDRELRARSLAAVTSQNLPGYALGGLAVGESKEELWEMVAWAAPQLPADRPRYLMGVGEPLDLLWAIGQGVDMFDCVLPTRLARHGSIWVVEGEPKQVEAFWAGQTEVLLQGEGKLDIVRLSFPSARWAEVDSPVQPFGPAYTAALSRRLASHLFKENEIGVMSGFSEHNLCLLQTLLAHARRAIIVNRYAELADRFGLSLAEGSHL